jgi:hypothetical protein
VPSVGSVLCCERSQCNAHKLAVAGRGSVTVTPDERLAAAGDGGVHVLVATCGGRARARQALELVCGAAHPQAPAIEYMGVDHCRAEIRVAKQFLHRSNVGAAF